MRSPTPAWSLKVRSLMDSTGKNYWECCAILGRRGGIVSAARRSSRSKALGNERRKQEAIGIR